MMKPANAFTLNNGHLIHEDTGSRIPVAKISAQSPPSACFREAARACARLSREAGALGCAGAELALKADADRNQRAAEACALHEVVSGKSEDTPDTVEAWEVEA